MNRKPAIVIGLLLAASIYILDDLQRIDVLTAAVQHYSKQDVLGDDRLQTMYLRVLGAGPSKRLRMALTDFPIQGDPGDIRTTGQPGVLIINISSLSRKSLWRFDVSGTASARNGGWGSGIIIRKKDGEWRVVGEAGNGIGPIKSFKKLFPENGKRK